MPTIPPVGDVLFWSKDGLSVRQSLPFSRGSVPLSFETVCGLPWSAFVTVTAVHCEHAVPRVSAHRAAPQRDRCRPPPIRAAPPPLPRGRGRSSRAAAAGLRRRTGSHLVGGRQRCAGNGVSAALLARVGTRGLDRRSYRCDLLRSTSPRPPLAGSALAAAIGAPDVPRLLQDRGSTRTTIARTKSKSEFPIRGCPKRSF